MEVFDLLFNTNPDDFINWLQAEFFRQSRIIFTSEDEGNFIRIFGEGFKPNPDDGIFHDTFRIKGSLIRGDESELKKESVTKIIDGYEVTMAPGLITEDLGELLSIELRKIGKRGIQAVCSASYFFPWNILWEYILDVQNEIMRVYKPTEGFYSVLENGELFYKSFTEDFSIRSAKRRKQGPSPEVLSACTDGMKYWLDDDKNLTRAAELAGVDRKTILKWIPNVLDLIDDNKLIMWIRKLKAIGRNDYLGKDRDD